MHSDKIKRIKSIYIRKCKRMDSFPASWTRVLHGFMNIHWGSDYRRRVVEKHAHRACPRAMEVISAGDGRYSTIHAAAASRGVLRRCDLAIGTSSSFASHQQNAKITLRATHDEEKQ